MLIGGGGGGADAGGPSHRGQSGLSRDARSHCARAGGRARARFASRHLPPPRAASFRFLSASCGRSAYIGRVRDLNILMNVNKWVFPQFSQLLDPAVINNNSFVIVTVIGPAVINTHTTTTTKVFVPVP